MPSFPTIREELHTTNQMVQHTFSIFLAGFAISQLIYGTLSDRYGRKPFLIIDMVMYTHNSISIRTIHPHEHLPYENVTPTKSITLSN